MLLGQSPAALCQERKLTIEQVITLCKSGVPDEKTIQHIREKKTVFKLEVEDILRLNDEGVSTEVIKAMSAPAPSVPAPKKTTPPAQTAMATGKRDVLLIIDASASMAGKTTDGYIKIDVAKEILNRLIQGLADDLNVGLLAYGHRYSAKHPQTCEDIELVAPVALTDKSLLADKVRSMLPRGKTPITTSLIKAAEVLRQLGGDREKVVVLVTDGLETCGGDPLQAAATLKGLGVELKFYVIGFDLTTEEVAAIRAIAVAGDGEYRNARDAAELADVFGKVVEPITRGKPPEPVRAKTGPAKLRAVGSLGDYRPLVLRREDKVVEMQPVGDQHGLTIGEFWGLGARILQVANASVGANAGFQPGDVVIQAGDAAIQTGKQLQEVLAEFPDGRESHRLRFARFSVVGNAAYTLELPAGSYTLVGVAEGTKLELAYDTWRLCEKDPQRWLALDQGYGVPYIVPLVWGFRVEPMKENEINLTYGMRFEHTESEAQKWDVLRIVDAASGTEYLRLWSGDKDIDGEDRFMTTIPVPAGRYTIEWARYRSDDWYTIVEDYEFDGKSVVPVKF